MLFQTTFTVNSSGDHPFFVKKERDLKMTKLTLNKETIRNLDKETLGKVVGGLKYNDTASVGRKCSMLYCTY